MSCKFAALSIYLHPVSPNTACNYLLHMISPLCSSCACICMSISLRRYRFLIFSFICICTCIYIYIHTHMYFFIVYIYISMYFIYAYICILFSVTFSHVSSARAPPQCFSPLFQFHFAMPQFHFTAAKKVPETCAGFPLPCMFPSSAHLCDLWFSFNPPGPQLKAGKSESWEELFPGKKPKCVERRRDNGDLGTGHFGTGSKSCELNII